MPTGFDVEAGEKLVQRAKDIRPVLLRNAQANEDLGYLTDEVMDALIDIEVFKMAAPKRWGGLGLSVNAMARVAAELSRSCPSTGWVAGLMNSALWLATMYSDPIQEELFADGIPRMCNVGQPGLAAPTDGGFLVTGRWDYASGCRHSEWAQLMVVNPTDDPPIPGFALIPIPDLTIENTWNVAGLKGTGSDTLVAQEVFVPEHLVHKMTSPLDQHAPDKNHVGEASDYWSPLPLLKSKALGVLVGTAEGLLDSVTQSVKEKPILFTSYARKADSPVFQAAIGEASAKISVARLLMEHTTSLIDEAAVARQPMAVESRVVNRGQTAAAADLLFGVATKLMNAAGSSSFNNANLAQRYWRDLNVAGRHALLIPEMGYEIVGRFNLGIEPNIAPPDMY